MKIHGFIKTIGFNVLMQSVELNRVLDKYPELLSNFSGAVGFISCYLQHVTGAIDLNANRDDLRNMDYVAHVSDAYDAFCESMDDDQITCIMIESIDLASALLKFGEEVLIAFYADGVFDIQEEVYFEYKSFTNTGWVFIDVYGY